MGKPNYRIIKIPHPLWSAYCGKTKLMVKTKRCNIADLKIKTPI